MRLLAFGIGLSLLCSPAAAQQVDPAVTAAAQSRKAYYDCVYESVAAQLQQMPISARRNADFSSLGEQGFLACATEERVLGMTLSINNVSPQVVQAALLVARAQIKRTLRDIAANAEKNGTPQQSQSAISGSSACSIRNVVSLNRKTRTTERPRNVSFMH
jgi:hypothetical protein